MGMRRGEVCGLRWSDIGEQTVTVNQIVSLSVPAEAKYARLVRMTAANLGVLCGLKEMVAGDIAGRIPAFDTVPTVQKYADELRPQCDLVIALTHIGYEAHNPGDLLDSDLAAATRNIDIIVGGHSHTFLEEAVKVKNLDGREVPIVQVGWMGAYMGEFKVTR